MKIDLQPKSLMAILLILTMVFSLVGYSSEATAEKPLNPNPTIISENIKTEDILTEDILTEHITEENYLQEMVVAEDAITEMLLSEKTISEVLLCKTIYVPQENIEEFSEHSQTTHLFGEGVDISSVLTKVAVGTGVIVTLTVLKVSNFAEPIASIVVAAADSSLKFGAGGAAIGSVFGGLTGAADEVDKTGRSSAVIGFATATAGLILSIVSLATVIPSVGTTTVTTAAGIKLVIAGVSVLAATTMEAKAGYDAVKTFTTTDAEKIDWNNINWNDVGVSAAEQAINNGADGYVWGSIIGAVYGGAEGYDFYQKYNTPYTSYNARYVQTPKDGDRGHWTGTRGESEYVLNEPIELPDGTKITKVRYQNCVPDFSEYQIAQVKIKSMTNSRAKNFRQARQVLRDYWNEIEFNGEKHWTLEKIIEYEDGFNLTWHEMSNMESMQMVPFEVNDTFGHCGGVAEYNAMIGLEAVDEFE